MDTPVRYAPFPSISSCFNAHGVSLYSGWDAQINPRYLIEKVFGKTSCAIDDRRTYTWKALDHLINGGAELIESSITIDDDASKDDSDMILRKFETIFKDEASRRLFWYKGNLIVITNTGEDGCVISFYWPIDGVSIHDEFKSYLVERKKGAVSILLNSNYGLTTKSVDFEPPVIGDLNLNYGTGFTALHEQIVTKLAANKAGLHLYHGAPGSGKSTYIKHLTTLVDREFIFIPTGMAGELSSPAFLKLLMEHTNAILVLEDAEQALQSREVDAYTSSTVSTLLNISDGILGNLLNITIIATYNADKQTIDKALLRKGRLAFTHTFDKLSIDDAKRLAQSLNKTIIINEPTSLADIYNAEDNTNYSAPKTRTMGFGGS